MVSSCTFNSTFVFQDVFAERVKIHKAWKYAETMLTKKREAKVKLELANKKDKLLQAQKDCEEVGSKYDCIRIVR